MRCGGMRVVVSRLGVMRAPTQAASLLQKCFASRNRPSAPPIAARLTGLCGACKTGGAALPQVILRTATATSGVCGIGSTSEGGGSFTNVRQPVLVLREAQVIGVAAPVAVQNAAVDYHEHTCPCSSRTTEPQCTPHTHTTTRFSLYHNGKHIYIQYIGYTCTIANLQGFSLNPLLRLLFSLFSLSFLPSRSRALGIVT
jgi:hypothetical protein